MMNAQLRTADLVVLLLYMAGVFGLGCWFARKGKTTSEFIAAGGALPGWAVGLSIFGTYVSSIGFLGNAGKAFGGTWNSWVFGLSLPIVAVIAVRYFVPFYRNSKEVSAYSHLEHRFGPWARTYALICYLLAQLARMGTVLYLVALALAPLTGWDIRTIIFLTGVLVTIYTLLGGIEAVIWTDVVQSVVLIAGSLLCATLLLVDMPGGWRELFQVANDQGKFSLGSFDLSPSSFTLPDPTFWVVLIYGCFINLQNFGIDQNFVQRYFTAKSDRDARASVWLAAIMFPFVSALFFFIGTGLFSLYEADTSLSEEVKRQVAESRMIQAGDPVSESALEAAAATLTAADIGDKVLPHFIVKRLPVGLAGLLIAAIFAAAMSSVDTSLNSSATVFYCDIYKRYWYPEVDERQSMRVLQIATIVFGVAGTLTALAMIHVKSALDAWWNLQGVFTGGMLGLFLLGLISKRARNPQAMLAVVVGVALILWMSISTLDFWPESWAGWSNRLHSFMTIVLGTSSIVLVGVLASLIANFGKDETSKQL